MSWQAVARKDFQDAVRSWWLWGLSVVFVGIFSLPALLRFYFDVGQGQQGGGGSSDAFIVLMKEGASIFVPLIAIVIAYAAITRERESGTLKLLLSLPHSREDVVLGKVLGRGGVIATPILVGFVISLLVLLPTSLTLKFGNFLLFALLTVLLGLVFVGLSVGLSAALGTSRRAMVGATGLFMFFTFFWNLLANQLVQRLGIEGASRFTTTLFLKLLNPIQAYKTLADTLVAETALQARIAMFGFFNRQPAAQALGDSLPVQFSDPLVLVYMLAWLFVPVAVGYLAFDDADL